MFSNRIHLKLNIVFSFYFLFIDKQISILQFEMLHMNDHLNKNKICLPRKIKIKSFIFE
jgi:hypothetical protein